ncbi:MAG: TlpA disulfide reductase family protein [Bacteroidota bacterium]|uniref:TlpA disulfide reductase family protein n=1 Tax=Flagellimonas okinawensis TaxID=3031324 RepID=A0ABT5XSI4_9FLAO|nr:TlpA disulfide reductase family protein [[Muricauda] okinawensis]MDF0708855.1 TlpA disulfide reductase family protein [[Muricauda] okinawensis]MEC8832409.1 TlpA disulfide reductase family protein [Bacteroidota bacterium]
MKISKKTVLNIVLILFVLSFFVTPIGYYGKIWLNRLFAFSPDIIEASEQQKISDYDWRLKDEEWNFFNFNKSKGKVIFINLWASWRLPCEAELASIQELYDQYKGKMDFYIITNEEQAPVEAFMEEHGFTFPVTYLIIGDKMAVDTSTVPSSYLIDKSGNIVIHEEGISDWSNRKVYTLLDELIAE